MLVTHTVESSFVTMKVSTVTHNTSGLNLLQSYKFDYTMLHLLYVLYLPWSSRQHLLPAHCPTSTLFSSGVFWKYTIHLCIRRHLCFSHAHHLMMLTFWGPGFKRNANHLLAFCTCSFDRLVHFAASLSTLAEIGCFRRLVSSSLQPHNFF